MTMWPEPPSRPPLSPPSNTQPASRPSRSAQVGRAGAALRAPLTVLGGALLGVAIMLLYLRVSPPPGRFTEADVQRITDERIASMTPTPQVAPILYAQLRPAVVLITIAGRNADNTSFNGRGAGVVVDENGSILTSLHVVTGAQQVDVRFYDGSTASAKVVQTQPERDLAIIQVQKLPEGIQPATLGGGVSPGDAVLAVGAPFGLDASVSQGIVSATGRRFKVESTGQTLENMIQFDAAVNPGNSGGPLVDMAGRVVGVVAGIANPTGQNVFIGLGFAVPIQAAAGLMAPIS
ncbi:MAG: trypsin-like peptidase domain-containing protein [Dehalococcoidia bacterium]